LTDATPRSPKPAPRRPWRIALTVTLVVATAGALGVYAARRSLARDAVSSWLRAQGVESQIAFQAFDPGGFTGALRVGPANDPDFTAESIEIRYDLLGFWTGDRLGARVTSVRLVRPTLKARWHDGRLSLGALDPLIASLRKRPPDPNSPIPDIEIRGARLRLDTDQGRLDAVADGQIQAGRLDRLDVSLAPARLAGSGLSVRSGPAELHLIRNADLLAVAFAGQIAQGQLRQGAVSAANLRLTGQIPYPDLKARRLEGEVIATLETRASRAGFGDAAARDLVQTTTFRGQAAGWGQDLALTGVVDGALQAAQAELGATRLAAPSASLQATEVAWTRQGGDRVRGRVHITLGAQRLSQADLSLTRLGAQLTGQTAADSRGLSLDLTGRAATRGAWTGLGVVKASDSPGDAGLKRALAAFAVEAPGLSVRAGPAGLSLDLPRPMRLSTSSGGRGQLTRLGGPLYDRGAGGLRLTLSGGGLPQADLALARYRIADGAFTGQAELKAKGSLGPVAGGEIAASGAVRMAGGVLTFNAERCAQLGAARLELGANDVADIGGQLCPTAGPLFQFGHGGWRAQGAVRGLMAQVPFLQLAASEADGPISLASTRGELALSADIRRVRLTDTAQDRRFNPLLAQGHARLANRDWTGDFALSDPAGRALAQARLVHDGRTGAGGLSLDTGALAFAPKGLQPSALSPKAAMIGDPAEGSARFRGHVDWTTGGSTSGGELEVSRLDFMSPAGAVSGLKGRIVFTSLVPLVAAPGQSLEADAVAALTPLTHARVTFGLDHDAVQVAAAGFSLSGGQVTVEPFEIPFAGGTWRAAVTLDQVELSDLVEASPFADRMDLKAKVSGRIPFAMTPQGVRIEGGELHAVTPGRISIRREALTGVQGAGGAPAVDPKAPVAAAAETAVASADPYSDFVYQAMENLSFDALTAEVASRPGGRLGVIFHIKGEHDPPQKAEIKLTAREVLTRKITRSLPLPSGTKVDLTLDTSVNLDQLLGDLADYQRLRGSRPVQP
jgi:hypothetical protein